MYNKQDEEALPVTGGDDDQFSTFQFDERSIRHAFIKKVYCILMCQLIVTIGIMCLFMFVESVRVYSINNPWMWYVALAMSFVLLIVLACCPDVRRAFPQNLICLGLFTLCEGFLMGAVASCYETTEVMMAVGIVAVVTLALTIFAMQTKLDFTAMGGILLVFLIVLICFGLLCALIQNRYASIAYASLGALLFAVYIVFDTQMMLGGKHKYSLSPEEYIFAALNLYLDIVNMFLFILSIIGLSR